MGKNCLLLLKFAIQYPTWHTYGKDRATVDAIRALANHGLINVNDHRQFRLALGQQWAFAIDRQNEWPENVGVL